MTSEDVHVRHRCQVTFTIGDDRRTKWGVMLCWWMLRMFYLEDLGCMIRMEFSLDEKDCKYTLVTDEKIITLYPMKLVPPKKGLRSWVMKESLPSATYLPRKYKLDLNSRLNSLATKREWYKACGSMQPNLWPTCRTKELMTGHPKNDD